MRAIIFKKNLQEGFSLTERITPRSPSLPILSTVLCLVESSFTELSATDLEVGIRYKILSKNEKPGSAIIFPRIASQFVEMLPEGPVVLEKKEENIHITGGDFEASLKTLHPEDFPLIPSLKGDEDSVEIHTASLCDAVSSVIGFVGQSQARPEVSGIFFSFDKKVLSLASTDSFRLAEKTTQLSQAPQSAQACIVPAKTAREILLLFGNRSGAVKIFLSPTQILFDYKSEGRPEEPQIQLVSRLIEGEYPRYQDIIPSSFQTKAILPKNKLLDRIKAAGIFSGKTNDVLLSFDPSKKNLEISTNHPNIGTQHSNLEGEIQGGKMEISFNWRFLAEGLAHIKEEYVSLNLSASDGPVLIKPTQAPDYFHLLMPLKL